MFEGEYLLSMPEKSLGLDTRAGHKIENTVEPPPSPRDLEVYRILRREFGRNWIFRKDPASYNCYGMALASRRTSIFDDSQLPRIFHEDGLRITDEEDLKPGDLVFYKDRQLGYIHVAVVAYRKQGQAVSGAIWALSKWASTMGEDLHNIHEHAWINKGMEIDLEFRTDRA